MVSGFDDVDAQGTLALVEAALRGRRRAELDDLLLAGHWAALHSAEPERRHPLGDKLVQLGGEGTPKVRELCLPELAIARDVHTLAARALVADVLDLQHRLPLVWQVVQALDVEAWLARKVASATRGLTAEQAAWVDARVAPQLTDLSTGRVLTLVEALVIEADVAAYEEKLERARSQRHVSLGRTDEHGLRNVIARVLAGDAAFIDATVDRVADLLAEHPEDRSDDLPDDPNRDQLRAEAFGWLGRPAQLLQLLARHLAPEPEAEPSPAVTPDPAALAAFVKGFTAADLSRIGPRVSLFVHLHEDTLLGADGASPLVRVEGVGPMLLSGLASLLGHARVSVTPVIDCRETVAVDSYELPDRMRTRIRLRTPAEAFPGSVTITGVGRDRVDLDHSTPYRSQGPPGQTGDHNAAPLTRGRHRAKTHLGYRVVQLFPNVWLWRTPHGLWRVVHPGGTHVVDERTATYFECDTDEQTVAVARAWWTSRLEWLARKNAA